MSKEMLGRYMLRAAERRLSVSVLTQDRKLLEKKCKPEAQ